MNSAPVHVAVGVIRDTTGRVLIAKRPAHLHQGGLWEFPGGKVQPGETVHTALQRELQEELGISITQTRQLISIHHDYGDKQVVLDVHAVEQFTGTASGREGQETRWVSTMQLADYNFPAANRAIIRAICLPQYYLITPAYSNLAQYLTHIERVIDREEGLVQVRAHHFSVTDYHRLAQAVLQAFSAQAARVILNTTPAQFHSMAGGLHLRSDRLMRLSERPVGLDKLLGASVHSRAQIEQANRIGVDYLLLAPVLKTATHPDAALLGWEGFAELAAQAACPVYALGGLHKTDLPAAIAHGAQGVAGISAFFAPG